MQNKNVVTLYLMDFIRFLGTDALQQLFSKSVPKPEKSTFKRYQTNWNFFLCNPFGISIPTAFHQSLKESLRSLRKNLAALFWYHPPVENWSMFLFPSYRGFQKALVMHLCYKSNCSFLGFEYNASSFESMFTVSSFYKAVIFGKLTPGKFTLNVLDTLPTVQAAPVCSVVFFLATLVQRLSCMRWIFLELFPFILPEKSNFLNHPDFLWLLVIHLK